MSRADFSPQLHTAIDAARQALAAADALELNAPEIPESHEKLADVLHQLLGALDADRSARLSVQHDAEFRNLCRAARMELYAATGSLQRLVRFEQALTRMIWPDTDQAAADRCPAAHPDDATPCGGPVVVTVLDTRDGGAKGCEHHAARLLASLERGRVYPLPDAPEGAASRVFRAAGNLRPFEWLRRGGDGS
ncbi:hypothetical protein ACFOSC_26450 [Streptantibioticus rubrisoli]|uniref:Uncharacterized protein n=1 Tax=Streptantibioticus rubrisoli TaxID=1387313 RepID=A0ABT1PEV5_9ACTN|nr:hypothetical protein [Streptantibioticus rubrisoli]MCQ4043881.1 hypothetical protein [Streptantibioticus rubrisoli]